MSLNNANRYYHTVLFVYSGYRCFRSLGVRTLVLHKINYYLDKPKRSTIVPLANLTLTEYAPGTQLFIHS